MVDRTFLWGGRSPQQRRVTELGGCRRHDEQRLLVELELDDSMYQGILRAGMEQNGPRSAGGPTRRATNPSRNFQPSYEQEFIAEPKPRLQTRVHRESTAKPPTQRQMQQLHARRLSRPYKLKQQVQGIRNEHQQSHHYSQQRVIRSPTLQQSPAQIVIETIQQNIYLRDQVMAHLQQELMGVLPLHRASHVEKNVPQRVVKLLNRIRSLSLAVVETVVYLNGELGESDVEGVSAEHDILEQDFYGYLLKMATSDMDFLTCSPPLQRFFEDFEVNLTRNPFVDGLSLDSSEVLLCSCHQSSSSGVLFRSASSSSSSLLRLLTQKLEMFALQTQRYLHGWQILPAERVAAALLHLMDLETRYNAVRMIPRYLQSHGDNRRHLHQHRGPNDTSNGYGTFQDERIQRLDRQDSRVSYTGGREAWTGSPTLKTPAKEGTRPPSARNSTPNLHDQPKTLNDSARGARKQESVRSNLPPTSAWTPIDSEATREEAAFADGSSVSSATSAIPQYARRMFAEAVGTGHEEEDNVELTHKVMPLPPLDIAALAKTSSRSNQSERPAKKTSRKVDEKHESRSTTVDVGIEMSKPNTPAVSARENEEETSITARTLSARFMRDEEMQVYEEGPGNLTSVRIDTQPSSFQVQLLTSSRDSVDQGLRDLTSVEAVPITEKAIKSSVECDVENTVEMNDDGYECDFEYSSNKALSRIAMALQMLPSFSFSNSESTLTDEVLIPEEAKPPHDAEIIVSSRSETYQIESELLPETIPSSTGVSPALTSRSLQNGAIVSVENIINELEIVEERTEVVIPEDDEYAYSSSTAISNIAMALSLLPSIWKNDVLAVREEECDHPTASLVDIDSPRICTYQSITTVQSPFEHPPHIHPEEPAVDNMPAYVLSNHVIHSSPASSRTSALTTMSDKLEYSLPPSSRYEAPLMTSSSSKSLTMITTRAVVIEQAALASSRSNISATKSYQGDDESEPSEFNRIFSLCRDIQGAAFGMSNWVSQREVEDHIQSVAQPFSSIMGYSSPTTPVVNTPKYLERELKMLRRNFTRWKEDCAEQKRAKQVVRRAVARRKIRRFIHFHHQRRLKAQRDEVHCVQTLAACRIQWNWRLHRHNQEVSRREAVWRLIHMRFYRMLCFMSISKRLRQREYAKEKVVRWWRHQRSRIKKNKQRQDKINRERVRRARALKDIQKFLKEILLRRKLKAAQEMTKNILFKEQLKWTKAKRDVEKSMNLNSKHRRELIADMDARLADLDRRWQTSEEERLKLLTHHERVVQQQQQALEVRRRRLAAMKLQMFFRVCLLHKKVQRVETEKQQYALQLHNELLAKEKLGVEAEKRVGKTRTQVRVLERKLNRMSLRAVQTETQHRTIVQAHQDRERVSEERVAKQKIKAFVDARVLFRRSESERRQMLVQQALLQAEKTEIELMSSEDQIEQQRIAASIASELRQRLFELESHSESLLHAKNQLAAEKELEAKQAAALLDHSRVESSMQMIASWVSGQVQLSKVKKEKAAVCASAAHEMEEEKRRQRKEIDAKIQEINSMKASSVMNKRISQQRNHRTVEMMRVQQQQKAAQERIIAERTRCQLVQGIIVVKLLAECECIKGVGLALDGVARLHKTVEHKCTRMKHLRGMTCARKIQRAWRRRQHHKRIKRARQQILAQFELAKQRQALARRVQAWWRKWTQEQQRRREQQRVFDAHLEMITVRANAHKMQRTWRAWVVCERERRREQELVFDAQLEVIRIRANARKIQSVWRCWVTRERERKHSQQVAFDAHLEAIRLRANALKIQRTWRRWRIREQERRYEQQQFAFEVHLESIRVRANVRKIQGAWKRWTIREQNRRNQQQLAFNAQLKAIRIRSNVRKIQRVWRQWIISEQERRNQQEQAFEERLEAIRAQAGARKIQRVWSRWVVHQLARRYHQQIMFGVHLEVIRTRANVRKIQRSWRRYVKSEQNRRCQQQKAFDAHLEAILVRALARKTQTVWRRWIERNQEQRERRRLQRLIFFSTVRIQRWWKIWQQNQRDKAEQIRILREISAQVIRLVWQQWQRAEKEKKRLRIQSEVCARKARRFRDQKRRRDLSASRIQRRWKKWHTEKMQSERLLKAQMLATTILIQRNWQCKLKYEKEKERRSRSSAKIQRTCYRWWQQRQNKKRQAELKDEELLQVANALKIQTFWRNEQKLRREERDKERLVHARTASSLTIQRNWGNRQHRRKMERESIQYEQDMSALKIQTLWLKWHHKQQEELERERIRQEQDESSLKIQRSWGISQRRQKVANERLRHKQNFSALKIQKHWRRRRHLRLEQRSRKKSYGAEPKHSRSSSIAEQPVVDQLQQERQQKLDVIKHRSYGRLIARAVNKYHQYRWQNRAATRIGATWKGKICRMQYLDVLEVKRAEEARQYLLKLSVFATKVQVSWRRWHKGVRQVKRAAVKEDELRLIKEAKAIERKVLMVKRIISAKRIQRAIVSWCKVQVSQDVPNEVVVATDNALDEEPLESLKNDSDLTEPVDTPEEDLTRADVEKTVEDWSHRELPHILTRSINQILFCHDAARVLQKFVREYQKRQRMHFYFHTSPLRTRELNGDVTDEYFHFYLRKARAWLEWDRSKSTSSANLQTDPTQLLRLCFDSQMMRKLLQMFEPEEEYSISEIQQVLHELAHDALPILQSPICLQNNDNLRPELCYHDVDEMELSCSVALLRQMGQRRAQLRRQQLQEIDTSIEEAPSTLPSPVAKSTPSFSSKKGVTIFTAVEDASVEDATFLQQRGADIAAIEPKMQRNVLHMLSFSKESYRARAEMLEFLLNCGANLNANAVDCNGDTPLMLYASLGHLTFMQKLVEHGADIQMTNRKSQNVLHRACEDDQVEICGFLQQLMTKDSVAEMIPIETIATLVPAALSLHAPDNAGRYPMHCLAEKGFVECAKQLVVPTEANYEWNRTLQAQGDAQGRTALHLAVLTHDTAMTAFLLIPGGGSNVNAFDDLHRSAVHYAVESPAALAIIARLVQHGANLNVADERGDTPLHWAAFSGRAAVAQNLLALGADPTLVNSDWETPAQIAAAYGQLDCMRLLLQGQRRHGPASTVESTDQQQQQVLIRPATEKSALERLEEARNHLHAKQAAQSYHAIGEDTDLDALATNDAVADGALLAEQSHRGYWGELHQDVQLVEESGQFSSEDEEDLLFGHDDF